MPDARRLIIRDTGGQIIRNIDLDDIENANSQCPLTVEIETRCDLGEWHNDARWLVKPWGRAIKTPTFPKRDK